MLKSYTANNIRRYRESGETREKRELAWLEQAKKRAELFSNYLRVIDECTLETPHQEVVQRLEVVRTQVLSMYPEEIRQASLDYITCIVRIEELENSPYEEDEEKAQAREEWLEKLHEDYYRFRRDEDVVFLTAVNKQIDAMIRRNRDVLNLVEEGQEAAVAGMCEQYLCYADQVEVDEVEFLPFGVAIVLDEESDNDLLPQETDGRFSGDGLFFLVRNNQDKAITIRHEYTHLKLSASADIMWSRGGGTMTLESYYNIINGQPRCWQYTQLVQAQEHLNEFKGLMSDAEISEIEQEIQIYQQAVDEYVAGVERGLLRLDADVTVNALYGELIPLLAQDPPFDFDQPAWGSWSKSAHPMLAEINRLDTAGEEYDLCCRYLDVITQHPQASTAARRFCSRLWDQIDARSRMVLEVMRDQSHVAQRLGQEAEYFSLGVFATLRPTQYGRVEQVMQHALGEDYLIAAESFRLVDQFVGDMDVPDDWFDRVSVFIASSQGGWHDLDRERMKQAFEDRDVDMSQLALGAVDIGSIRERCELVDRVLVSLGIDNIQAEVQRVYSAGFHNILRRTAADEFIGLAEVYQQLEEDEVEGFRSEVENYMCEFFMDDHWEDMESPIESPHWQVLEELNLVTDKMQDRFNR